MYASLINPVTVVVVFALLLNLFAIVKPQATRIFMGIFFLLMAFGVNLTVLLTDPTLMAAAGKNALLPVYRWFFTTVIAWNPALLTGLLIAFEATVGGLLLSKGKYVRCGLILAIVFCLWLTPVGIEELTTPLIALALGLLLRKDYDKSIIDMIARRRQSKVEVRAG